MNRRTTAIRAGNTKGMSRWRIRIRLPIVIASIAAVLGVLILLAPWQATAQATVPGAPSNLTATPGGSEVTLTWEAPSSDGGAAITRYEFRHSLGTPTSLGALAWTAVGTELTATVSGLINGREYTFEVRAVNSAGEGASVTIRATPVGGGPLTALSVSPGTPSGGHRPGSLSPAFSSSTYEYTVSVLHSDSHLTFEATTETGYGKQLRIVGDLGYGEFWFGARDMGSSVPGHQVRLSYGVNWFRYAVHTGPDGTESDGTAEYHYDITVTRPYPPLRVSGVTQKSHVENRTELLGRYNASGPGHSAENQTWSLSGNDSDDFTLVEEVYGFTRQVLRFSQAPDYENPSDLNTDNVYEVTVQVSEGDETASLDVTVTVTDVIDDPGLALNWLGVWTGSVDIAPQDPDEALEITEGTTLSLSVRPRCGPGPVQSISYQNGGSGQTNFKVTAETSDSSKLAPPEANNGSLFWSLTNSIGWQAWHTIRFTAPEDDDTDDDTATLTFYDRNGVYNFDFMTFTVNISDNDDVGGL